MRSFIVLLFTVLSLHCYGQSLSPERIKKIKDCTVQLTIEGSTATGSAFFISKDGYLLTCWHLIEPAFIRDASNMVTGVRKIFIVYPDGKKEEFKIMDVYLTTSFSEALGYDVCGLAPVNTRTEPYPYLALGNYDLVQEGQEVYTCGYPSGGQQQFVSKGIISTKYINDDNGIQNKNGDRKMPREEALLDINMTRGSSGGPVLRMGATPDQDAVIGIADLMITPAGYNIEHLSQLAATRKADNDPGTTDQMKITKYLADTFSMMPVGMGGCVSLNHLLRILGYKK